LALPRIHDSLQQHNLNPAFLTMIWPFSKRSEPSDAVYAAYNVIVAQSRQPAFYVDWSVEDSVTGRFNMICLHMSLILRRLRQHPDKQFGQDLFDLFFADMDRSLREMGVGDVSVPKRIEKMGAIFYGLLEKTTEALDNEDAAELEAVIARNLLDEDSAGAAKPLARYAAECARGLAGQEVTDILAGRIAFAGLSHAEA
jgi:cytochrome b pre-mRNA-processing protein 3